MKDSVFQKRFERKQQNRQVHGQQLTVFYRDMVPDFPVSGLVKLMLHRCEGSVSPGLYRQMANSLVGFEEPVCFGSRCIGKANINALFVMTLI